MERALKKPLLNVLGRKLILLSGPRQVGKTTLSKDLIKDFAYYNYDIKRDLAVFKNQEWNRKKPLVVFDELHKMKNWKLWLKGLYDDDILKKQKVLVTGSARMDIAKKMGDSLAGRFFSFRLYPLDLKELKNYKTTELNYKRLINFGGFPEPFFEAKSSFYELWQRGHTDLIIKQDLPFLENIRDLDGIELLIEMLSQRVGSTISSNSIAEDLNRDDKTIKKWLGVLENLYVIFRVGPYSKNIARGLKKASKYYFYDLGKVQGNEAAKLENLTALSLKKELDFQYDVNGIPGELYFIQTKEKKEIDFLILQKNAKPILLEVKLSEESPSPNFHAFQKYFKNGIFIQIVKNLSREFSTKDGIEVKYALSYLEKLNLLQP
ncbi:MAG: ATP-binding protein [Oligoflexia bacterium]|nr:ATP-binding protein [Oligoflexia bacterium]